MTHPITNSQVQAAFEEYHPTMRDRLLTLRKLIFEVAEETEGVGKLEETLKWGQISYLTPETKSGTTLRIDAIPDNPSQVGMFVHCQTTLVDSFRQMFADTLDFEGTRCVKFDANGNMPEEAIKDCIEMALTYHLSKKHK